MFSIFTFFFLSTTKTWRTNSIYAVLFYADKVTNTNKATPSITKELTFSLAAMKFCNSMLRATRAVPTQTFFKLWINTFLVGKMFLLFHQKTALCCMLILFHVKIKQLCFDQTQKRWVAEISFQNPFARGNQLHANEAANRQQDIMPVCLRKIPCVSANQHSVNLTRMR